MRRICDLCQRAGSISQRLSLIASRPRRQSSTARHSTGFCCFHPSAKARSLVPLSRALVCSSPVLPASDVWSAGMPSSSVSGITGWATGFRTRLRLACGARSGCTGEARRFWPASAVRPAEVSKNTHMTEGGRQGGTSLAVVRSTFIPARTGSAPSGDSTQRCPSEATCVGGIRSDSSRYCVATRHVSKAEGSTGTADILSGAAALGEGLSRRPFGRLCLAPASLPITCGSARRPPGSGKAGTHGWS